MGCPVWLVADHGGESPPGNRSVRVAGVKRSEVVPVVPRCISSVHAGSHPQSSEAGLGETFG